MCKWSLWDGLHDMQSGLQPSRVPGMTRLTCGFCGLDAHVCPHGWQHPDNETLCHLCGLAIASEMMCL